MAIKNQVQLITYPDSLGGNLRKLGDILLSSFANVIKGGVHLLPFYPSSADRGFAPLTYHEVDPAFGNWSDIQRIGGHVDVMADLMVNHISRQSLYFQDFLKKGRGSKYADLFITLDKIWPDGIPPQEDVEKIFLRKPDNPFSDVQIQETGATERIWTSFGSKDWAEQIDLDIHSEAAKELLKSFVYHLHANKVKMIRLDAVGYVIKKPGTSCFFVEPEIYEFMDWFKGVADEVGMELLPEVHSHYSIQFRLAEHGFWVYDFVLPMLILHSLFTGNSGKLREYLKVCPRKQFTMLDCHDGIPVQPDMDDILSREESKKVVDICLGRGANLNHILSTPNARKKHDDFDAHQINCTYYSALGCDDDAYLAARAIQFFAPGVPQVYYVGLLAGENNQQGVRSSGEGRTINRYNFSEKEVEEALEKPVVRRLFRLIEFRNGYGAFNGDFRVENSEDKRLMLSWKKEEQECRLDVDLVSMATLITYKEPEGNWTEYRV